MEVIVRRQTITVSRSTTYELFRALALSMFLPPDSIASPIQALDPSYSITLLPYVLL